MSDLISFLSNINEENIIINDKVIIYGKPDESIINLFDQIVSLLSFNNIGIIYCLHDKQKKFFSLAFISMMNFGKKEGILHSNHILSNLNHLVKNQDNRRIFLLNLFSCLGIFKSYFDFDDNKNIVKNVEKSFNGIISNFPETKKRSMTLEFLCGIIIAYISELDMSNFKFEGNCPFFGINKIINDFYLKIFLISNDAKSSNKTLNDIYTKIMSDFFNSKVNKNDPENIKKEKETIAENKVNKLKEFILNEINKNPNKKEIEYELFILYICMKKDCKDCKYKK